jgi:heme/copper-type cytochrome/quinol oxidase subunit 2
MDTIVVLFLVLILILLLWNIKIYYSHAKNDKNNDREYFELNAKLNFIVAVGSLAILLISYLGFNVKKEIIKNSEIPINEMVEKKSNEIDSLFASKNILKAGIYIINDLSFKENKVYKFKDLLTIDNKHLPEFAYAPKLIISTSTGENLRVEKVTNEFFVLAEPMSKNSYLVVEEDDPSYPKILKFDIWIADYKTK